jgi:hypothetical protein
MNVTVKITTLACPISTDPVPVVPAIRSSPRPEKNIGKLKKYTVHEFQNAHQVRMGCTKVNFSSSNAPST